MTDGAPTSGDPSVAWDAFVAGHPLATYLQTAAWARVKAANGWSSRLVETTSPDGGRFGARILLRRPRPVPWTFAYAPRGPLATAWTDERLENWNDALRSTLGRAIGVGGVAHVRVDPEIERDGTLDREGAARAMLERRGWRPAPEVQPAITRVVDLTGDEDSLWSGLRSKWRQYVTKARTNGISVEDIDADGVPSAFPTFHRIMTETSRRTQTPIRTEAAYRDIWDAFRPSGGVRLLFARDTSGDVGAVLLLVRCGTRVVEPYGGMTSTGGLQRAGYLLKWEAIRSSRELGATSYDMWGLVHSGIRQFKAGFGGREITLIGAWDLPISRVGWRAYRTAEDLRAPKVAASTEAKAWHRAGPD